MYDADKLIYLQLEKTGCTHISRLLSKCVSGKQIKKHNPLENYESSKLIVGSIRNPWDWYVSLWAYGAKGEGVIRQSTTQRSFQNALKLHSGTNDPFNFSAWVKQSPLKHTLMTLGGSYKGIWSEFFRKPVQSWEKSYADPYNPDCFRHWLKLTLGNASQHGLGVGYAQNPVSAFAGLMTYRYCRLYIRDFLKASQTRPLNTYQQLVSLDQECNLLDEIIRTESLESDFIRVLEHAGYSVEEEQLAIIESSPATNTSKRATVERYYDQETIDLIHEKDKFIIEKYNYQPPKLDERTVGAVH